MIAACPFTLISILPTCIRLMFLNYLVVAILLFVSTQMFVDFGDS